MRLAFLVLNFLFSFFAVRGPVEAGGSSPVYFAGLPRHARLHCHLGSLAAFLVHPVSCVLILQAVKKIPPNRAPKKKLVWHIMICFFSQGTLFQKNLVQTQDLIIFDLNIGFPVKFYLYIQIMRSIALNLGQNIKKFILSITFRVLNRCLAFPRGPGGFRELREAGRKHFLRSWYL